MTEYTRGLASYVASAKFEDLPRDVIKCAVETILDTFGCIIYGRTTVPGGIVAGVVGEFGHGGQSSVIGDVFRTAPPAAALANGLMAHAFEMDDRNTESMLHASASVLPAALAIGEKESGTGKDLINAMIIGHEVTCRVANTVIPESYVYGWHSQGWHPTFGAAAASAVMMHLDADKVLHSFGLAATSASGLIEVAFSSDGKPFHAGKASMGGVWAALLAQRGYTGGTRALEGSKRARGYSQLLSPEPRYEGILKDLGKDYKILTRNGLKPYSCAGDMHPGIEAVIIMMKKHNLKPEDVTSVTIDSFGIVPTHFNIPSPNATIEGLMSYQHAIAVAVLFQKAGPAQYTPQMLADKKIDELRHKVKLQVDPELDKLFPKYYTARTTLHTRKGDFSETILNMKGDPESPMTTDEIIEKFVDNASAVLKRSKAEELVDIILNLEKMDNVRKLGDLLRLK